MEGRAPQNFALKPRLKLWTDGTSWINWSRHEVCLQAQPKWRPHQISSVAEESLRIISKTTPIGRSNFQCRGLVVGYVQSGKTANFTAVAARAADVGYRLIIVLAGIHDSLRNQTQRRLNYELVDAGVDWITLTDTSDGDVLRRAWPPVERHRVAADDQEARFSLGQCGQQIDEVGAQRQQRRGGQRQTSPGSAPRR